MKRGRRETKTIILVVVALFMNCCTQGNKVQGVLSGSSDGASSSPGGPGPTPGGGSTPPPQDTGKGLLFTSDFESGILNDAFTQTPSQGWKRAGTMPVISTDHARRGKYSMKAYLNKRTSSTLYRTMLQSDFTTTSDPNNRPAQSTVPFFGDSWIGFSVYLPSTGAGNWMNASNTYEILAQWHAAHLSNTPSWDVEESANPLFMLCVTSTGGTVPERHFAASYLGESRSPFPVLGSPRPWHYEAGQSFDLGPIDPDLDKWVDWVVHIRWNFWKVGSSGNKPFIDGQVTDNVSGSPHAGLIQVWKNGVLVINQSPVQIGANDSLGAVFSTGLYKGWRTQAQRDADVNVTDRLMYFDQFRYGIDASYSTVAP